MGKRTWWYWVLDFAVEMIDRFEKHEESGRKGWDTFSEDYFKAKAITNINEGDYVDAANLCLLASKAKVRRQAR